MSDIVDRLRGKYKLGENGEFGERDFSSFIPPISLEAADKIEELHKECKRLWALLDDISTLGDIHKPEINPYFKAVNKKCDERDGLFYSDGYEILTTNKG